MNCQFPAEPEMPAPIPPRQVWHWMEGDVHQLGTRAVDDYGLNIHRRMQPDGYAYGREFVLMQDRFNPLILTWVCEASLSQLGESCG